MLLSVALTLMPALVSSITTQMEVIFQATGTNSYLITSCTPPVTGIKVDLKMDNVVDMWGWSCVVTWDAAILNCTGKGPVGPFNPSSTSVLGVIQSGTIPKLAASTVEEESIDGSGIIYTLTFKAIAHGITAINLTDVNWIDLATKTKHYIGAVNGTFECRAYVGPPTPPVASFTPAECSQFRLDKTTGNVTVDFDASLSTGSYDSLPSPGTSNSIIEYRWDFNGDSVIDYNSSALVTVALSVTNMQNYFWTNDTYFMGWSCNVTWDPTKCDFIASEKGPFPALEGPELEWEGPPGCIKTAAFGTTELVNVTDPRVQGGGIIAYLYFKPTTECTHCEVTVDNSFIATWVYQGGFPKVHKTPYTPQFAAAYTYTAPDPHASWTYTAMNTTMPVTLTVYAPDCDPSETHPDFKSTDSVTNVIHILPPSLGPDIDVGTQRNGIGDFGHFLKGCDKDTGVEYPPMGTPPFQTWTAMSDSFGPQELVTVCAKVSYNDEPVENKLVAFEVWDNHNNTVVYREAATNENGTACVSFRIPWMGAGAEGEFGAWLIIATVDIAEHVVMDKCRFRFGYLVYITGVAVDPASLHKLEDLGVTVTLGNIALTSKDVFLTIVLYDECGVPINHFGTNVTVTPVSKICPEALLTIPKWAFVGTGRVYVNVFDYPPYEMGVPMCPENSAQTFQILHT
jgi:hypothetical protein